MLGDNARAPLQAQASLSGRRGVEWGLQPKSIDVYSADLVLLSEVVRERVIK